MFRGDAATPRLRRGYSAETGARRRYFDRGASQLEWWGVAAREHKAVVDPFAASPALTSTPKERNAPQGP